MPLLEAPEKWFCPGPKSVKSGGGSSPNFTWLRSIGDIRAEKLKNWVNKATNMDKIKRLVVSKSPGCDRFRLWMVGITTAMLLQWVLSSQSGDDRGTVTTKVEAPPYFPPPWDYKNQGYLMVSCNGGLNQMRADVSLFLAINIWDVDYFIKSLSSEVRIIKHLPPRLRKKVETDGLYSIGNVNVFKTYLIMQVFPRFQKYEVVRFAKTDSRLGNNLAVEVQKMRCRVNYEALRYEMDMLAFSGCTQGCNKREVEELTRLRHTIPWWKEKEIDPKIQREAGLCPLTPLETALTPRAFNIDPNIQIYIAAGNIYGGNRRLASLKAFYPNLPLMNHSNQMAALDYLVSLDSDIFLPTYASNMEKVVEGHRRWIQKWNEFSELVKAVHANRLGSPSQRLQFPGKPKLEDTNPQLLVRKSVTELG
ncbi:hypothetical protein ES288_A13G110900v1 [Gossypium darwinii]|uniref:O-fucosyltransferase family protein n=1 Tax=Gossypium darwinii TaxID=34276 RepID=A0A5D2DYM4_GOSDA|nr:hypothetical protein ES288_A13G110900v1 [Gossypium darwinii]